jgi:hypothetical protein
MGEVQVIAVLFHERVKQLLVPMSTEPAVEPKFVPEIVIMTPPIVGKGTGATLVIIGCATAVEAASESASESAQAKRDFILRSV